MRSVLVGFMMAIVIMVVGCERRGGLEVGVNTGGGNSKTPAPVHVATTPVVYDDSKLVTTTTTVSTKTEELVPPPPVKKISVCTDTRTSATLNGVPVKPDVQVHETPKVLQPDGTFSAPLNK